MQELVEFILGVSKKRICKHVVLAPCWSPQSVGIRDVNLLSKASCEIWDCSLYGIRFTYIVSGVGAGNCADIMMALGETENKYALFLGSAGALTKEINIGDIAIPNEVICAEGASRYLQDELSEDVFGRKYPANEYLHNKVREALMDCNRQYDVNYFEGKGISVESIFSQYKHIEKFEELKCSFIDMESSAFLAAARKSGIAGTVIFCISDNVKNGEPLYSVVKDKLEYRKEVRKRIMPRLIQVFLEG